MVFPIINMLAAGIVIYFTFTAGALITGFEQKPKEKFTANPLPTKSTAPAEESAPTESSSEESTPSAE